MLAMKSALAALLAAFVLVVVPPLLRQDAGPGKPDDVAHVLPEETLAFVELVKAPRLLHDWKDYVGSLTTADGKDKACAFIEEWFTKALEIVPEKLLKDLKEGLPTIQRMAVAMTGMPDHEIPWIFVATSSDPAFFKKLVENDLSVFAAEEKAHRGVKIFAIRKMGELKSDHPVFVAAAGARLLMSTRWASLTDALDRAEGRGSGNDLRKNRLYAMFAPAASDDPVLRAFSRWDWDLLTGPFLGGGSNERSSRYEMDMTDAVFGIRKIAGTVSEATFKPGKVVSISRTPIDAPCRLYEAIRQPPGPKDLLAHLPKPTIGFAHANLKGGKEIWGDIEGFVRRFQEAERKGRPGDEAHDYLKEMDEHLKKDLGFAARDLAAVIGNEIAVALVDLEKPDPGWLVLARLSDPAKAREICEAAGKHKGRFAGKTEEGVTIYTRVKREGVVFGMGGSVLALGGDEATVKGALKSKDDAAGAVKRLPKDAAAASIVGAFDATRLVEWILKMSGTETPEFFKHLRRDEWTQMLVRTERDQSVSIITDAGPGALAQTALTVFPIALVGAFGMMMGPVVVMEEGPGAPAPDKPKPEPPALAAA
ncbi:MAG TPA: hypothetical protein VFS19_00705, partial [Planctomycetota bacterium]|nr:hypothetical protein [Planctomycetota bacterium]